MQDIQTTNELDQQLYNAIKKQQQMGIHSLPQGYIHKTWESIQQRWLQQTNNTLNLPKWNKQSVVILHTYTYAVWKDRNDILHDDKVKSKKAINKLQLQSRTAES